MQMRAIADLFDSTTLILPCNTSTSRTGETLLAGRNLSVAPLTDPSGQGVWRKIGLTWWLLRNGPTLAREIWRADAVHVPIPGDIGTIGMLLALLGGKRLFVRHCGNWRAPETIAEYFWKWLMQRTAGGRNVMFTTGGDQGPPSSVNPAIQWIFSTASTESELRECAVRAIGRTPGARLIIACRQDAEKGVGTVIKAIPLLQGELPDVTLDVVGDGPALDTFKQLARTLSLDDRVTFHGKVPHERVTDILQRASIFCFPTTSSEGFPKIVLEALACGLPVVTTRVSVLPELIGEGCGILLDEATPEAASAAVKRCLADVSEYEAMSRRAVQVAERYSLERWSGVIAQALTAAWGPLRDDPSGVSMSQRRRDAQV